MEFVDTHCHIQEAAKVSDEPFIREKWGKGGYTNPARLIESAVTEGVTRLICVGTTLPDSQQAVALAAADSHCWASIGLHPHEAQKYVDDTIKLRKFSDLIIEKRVVAVGECGLDYYYEHSPKEDQKKLLRFQLDLAQEHALPLIFHVRDAFDDFWQIFDEYKGVRGVIHSFSAHREVLDEILARGLYVGLNGIMTFTKDQGQLSAAEAVPLDKLVLETDAPFLTPVPYRGKVCEPKHVRVTAEFLSKLREESLENLAQATTRNARDLFGLDDNEFVQET